MKFRSKPLFVASALALAPSFVHADPSPTLEAALKSGKVNFDLRLRYETVADDGPLDDADALIVDTVLGYTTGSWHDFSGFVEFEGVNALVDDYNLPLDNPKAFSVIADPDDSEINQWGIRYKGIENLTATLGRSRLIFDNARWVGNVGWRANEQTYDGVFLKYTPRKNVSLQYANISNVNSIFFTNTDLDGHLINAMWAVGPTLSLTGYAYLLDFEPDSAATYDTIGVRATGGVPAGPAKLIYSAEFATQDAEVGGMEFEADYLLAELGVAFSSVTLKLGYELLGSDDGQFVVQTPLATLHAFNGWNDLFIPSVPDTGLEDSYVKLSGAVGKVKLLAAYHEFKSDEGSIDYGSEWNLLAKMPLPGSLSGGIKYGSYSADSFKVDTDKLWVWLQYKF